MNYELFLIVFFKRVPNFGGKVVFASLPDDVPSLPSVCGMTAEQSFMMRDGWSNCPGVRRKRGSSRRGMSASLLTCGTARIRI
jgi:hypothetical protein